jgi:hypothetical protein
MEKVNDNFVKFTTNEGKNTQKLQSSILYDRKTHKKNEKISDMKVGKTLHEIQANGITKAEKVNI